MRDLDDEFFRGKRPWSKIKDKVIEGYMPAYLRKVARLGKPILLVDGYAGPGSFNDGSPGSPFIMCTAAEQHVKDKYSAIFVNHKEAHHQQLETLLVAKGWSSRTKAILGDSTKFLQELSSQLKDQTVFVYLDPFGLKGCEFSTLLPFLRRHQRYSTELVVNISMPITHRLAAPKAKAEGREDDPRIISYRNRMTKVFGGEYWKEIYFSGMDADQKELALMEQYCKLISQYLPYTGSCPVKEDATSRIKYFITFASRHEDAMLLMNDEMCKAYSRQMHDAVYDGTVFSGLDWKSTRSTRKIDQVVLNEIQFHSGKTRKNLWSVIVSNHFMQFTSSEYRQSITRLAEQKMIKVEYTKTNRLNDQCKLFAI
jgi:three-Cys-motif partner protein